MIVSKDCRGVFCECRESLAESFSKFRQLVLIYKDTFENASMTAEQAAVLVENEASVKQHKEQYARVIESSQGGFLYDLDRWHSLVQDMSSDAMMEEFDRTFGQLSRILMDCELFGMRYRPKIVQQCAEMSQHVFIRLLACEKASFVTCQVSTFGLYKRLFSFYVSQLDKSVSTSSNTLYIPYVRVLVCLAGIGGKCDFDLSFQISQGDLIMEFQLLISLCQQVQRTVTKQDTQQSVLCFQSILYILYPCLPGKSVSDVAQYVVQDYELQCLSNILEGNVGHIGDIIEQVPMDIFSPLLLRQYHRTMLVKRREEILELQKKRDTSLPFTKPALTKEYILQSNIAAHIQPSVMTTCAALQKSTNVSVQTQVLSIHVIALTILIACHDDMIKSLHPSMMLNYPPVQQPNTSLPPMLQRLQKQPPSTHPPGQTIEPYFVLSSITPNSILPTLGFSTDPSHATFGIRTLTWTQETRARLDQWLPNLFQTCMLSPHVTLLSICVTTSLAFKLFEPVFLPLTAQACLDFLVVSLSSNMPFIQKKSVGSLKVQLQRQLLSSDTQEQRVCTELVSLQKLLQASQSTAQQRCISLVQGYSAVSWLQKKPFDSMLAFPEYVHAMCETLLVNPLDTHISVTSNIFAIPALYTSLASNVLAMYVHIGAYSSNPVPLVTSILQQLAETVSNWGLIDATKGQNSTKQSMTSDNDTSTPKNALETLLHIDMNKENTSKELDTEKSATYGYFSELCLLLNCILKGINTNIHKKQDTFQPFPYPSVSIDDQAVCLVSVLQILLLILQLPSSPQHSASEARSMLENITRNNIQPGQVWDEQLYRYTRTSQVIAIECVCYQLEIQPRPMHAKVLPRILTTFLQLCEVEVHPIQSNAQYGLLYIAKLQGFSDVGYLIRGYADQVVNEIATKITILHAKRDIERNTEDLLPEEEIMNNVTLLTVTRMQQQCRHMYDQCRQQFHQLVIVKPEIEQKKMEQGNVTAVKSLISIVDEEEEELTGILSISNDIDTTSTSDNSDNSDNNDKEKKELQDKLSYSLSQYKQLKVDCRRVIAQYECVCSSSTSIASVLTTALSYVYSHIDITSDTLDSQSQFSESADLLPMLRDVLLRSIDTLTYCVQDLQKLPLYVQKDEVPSKERIQEILNTNRDVTTDSLKFVWTLRAHMEHEVELALRCLHAVVAAIGSRSISLLVNVDTVFKEEYIRRYRGRVMRDEWKNAYLALQNSKKNDITSNNSNDSNSNILIEQQSSLREIEKLQLQQHFASLPVELGISSNIINHTTTLASIHTDTTCVPIIKNNHVYLPKQESSQHAVSAQRESQFTRVNVIVREKEERKEYQRAEKDHGKVGVALEWWEQLEKRRTKEEQEAMLKKSGQVDDLQDKEEASDFEYDSDFDEDVVLGKRLGTKEKAEIASLQEQKGYRNPKKDSVFEAKHRLFRLMRAEKEEASKRVAMKAEDRFGMSIEVIEKEEEDISVPPTEQVDAFAYAYCPYLRPGEDPYLDDPAWVTVPTVEASAIGQDGARGATNEETVLEIVLARLSGLAQWPNTHIQARVSAILQHTFGSLGVVGRVWTSLTATGVGSAVTQRELIRARQKAEREAMRRIQGKGGKKRNAFAGMIYGKEEWTMDGEGHTSVGNDVDLEEQEIPQEEQATVDALEKYNFYHSGEDKSIPAPVPLPARPMPPQHDIRVMPAVTRYWATLKFFMFPKHKSDQSKTTYSPALPAALKLAAVLLSIASGFLATKVQTEIWPLFKHTFARAVVDVTQHPFTQTKHTLAYRVMRGGLEFLLQCSLAADIAKPQAQEIMTVILPLTLHTQNDTITSIVRTILALLSMYDYASVKHILYNTAMKLGATPNIIQTVIVTMEHSTSTTELKEHSKYIPRNIPKDKKTKPAKMHTIPNTLASTSIHQSTWESISKSTVYPQNTMLSSTSEQKLITTQTSSLLIENVTSYVQSSLLSQYPESTPEDIQKRTHDILFLTNAMVDLKKLKKTNIRSLGYYEGQ